MERLAEVGGQAGTAGGISWGGGGAGAQAGTCRQAAGRRAHLCNQAPILGAVRLQRTREKTGGRVVHTACQHVARDGRSVTQGGQCPGASHGTHRRAAAYLHQLHQLDILLHNQEARGANWVTREQSAFRDRERLVQRRVGEPPGGRLPPTNSWPRYRPALLRSCI